MIVLFIIGLILLTVIGYFIIDHLKVKKVKEKLKNLEDTGQLEEAVQEYEKALKTTIDGDLLWRLARLHEKMGKKNLAITRLKDIVKTKKYPLIAEQSEVELKLAGLLYQDEKDEESFQFLLKYYQTNKDDQLILHYLTLIAMGQRRCDIAAKFIKDLLAANNKEAEYYLYSGVCYYEKGDYNQANKMFLEALENGEKDWRYQYLVDLSNFRTAKYSEVVPSLEKAIKADIPPEYAKLALRVNARCSYKLNSKIKALVDLDRGYKKLKDKEEELVSIDVEEDIFFMSIINKDLNKAKLYMSTLVNKEPDNEKWKGLLQIVYNLMEKQELITKRENMKNGPRGEKNGDEGELSFSVEDLDIGLSSPDELDILGAFAEQLEHWQAKDIIYDAIWALTNVDRKNKFDLNQYLNGNFFSESQEKAKPARAGKSVLSKNYIGLNKSGFLESSKKVMEKLHFTIVEEKYSSEEVFLAQGDGIDYIALFKGNEKDKYLVQIRRWDTDSIGELVIKDLADKLKEKNIPKGLFVTTGVLSQEAMNFVEQSDNIINIIQDKQLEHLLSEIVSVK